MTIDRHNYGEYFILYMDNELGSEERQAVESFAQAHPDLQEELELLLQSRLVPDTNIVFDQKQELFRSGNEISFINDANYEEWLVLYIDRELTPEQNRVVEHFIAARPAVQEELTLLRQAQLPVETIVFPAKASLYRKEEKTRPVIWWRMAAAALLVGAIATTAVVLINRQPGNTTGQEPLAIVQKTVEQPVVTPITEEQVVRTNDPQPTRDNSYEHRANDLANKSTEHHREPSSEKNGTIQTGQEMIEPQQVQNNIASTTKSDRTISPVNTLANDPVITQVATGNDPSNLYAVNTPSSTQQQNPNSSGVTQATTAAYHPTEAGNLTEHDDVLLASEKKSKFRGFLRKVTRTFEKKTNIETTGDDDRLLVGGLALRL